MRIPGVGYVFFAATMIVIGILGLIRGDFVAIWQSVPKSIPARLGLAYLCAVVALGSGLGLLFRRAAAPAARLLLAYLLLWLLLIKAPVIWHAPAVEVSWEDCAETAVIVAGAWILYAGFAGDWDRERFGFATGDNGMGVARTLYGLALIPFGVAHFAYVRETAALVPAWLPAHMTWAYFTGCTYILAGLAVSLGVYGRMAAALSAMQMAIFTVLVWGPIVAAGPKNAFQLNESLISCALTASGWVVADSFRGLPWLRRGRPANKPGRSP
jgi:uncharacterized membrane protein